MHRSSYDKMASFKEKYLSKKSGQKLMIFDIGSGDINGTYRSIFNEPGWEYVGVDTAKERNVDIVIIDPYSWRQVRSGSADVVISGQVFEHIEYPWLTLMEITRILKPGGLCCIIAPAGGPDHKYPLDCWRFHPDGLSALAKLARLRVLEVYAQWDSKNYPDGSDIWQDCVLICEKNRPDAMSRIRGFLARKMLYYSIKL